MVLVRPLQGHLADIRGVSGCALLSGGLVGMVLDMSYVLGELDPRSLLSPPQDRAMHDSLRHLQNVSGDMRSPPRPTESLRVAV